MKISTAIACALCTLSLPTFAQTIALKNVNLVDVENLTIIKEQTIVIQDDAISQVFKTGTKSLDSETIVLDLTDKYVIPGLIDGHVHHATNPDIWDNDQITRKRLRNLLRGGVTGVRDMGGDARALASLARRANNDVILAPDIYYSVIIGGPKFFEDPRTKASARGLIAGQTYWMRAVTEDSDLNEVMLTAKGTGATGIKIYAKVEASMIKKLAKAAKKHGLQVWSHVYVDPASPSEISNAGVEVISHAPDLAAEIIEDYVNWRRKNIAPDEQQEAASYQAENYQSLLKTLKENGTILDATMTVFDNYKTRSENSQKRYRHTKMLTQLAYQAGVKISAGTDAFSESTNQLHRELKLLVNDGGLTPLAAIQAATLHNAQVLGLENSIGTISEGKKANLVVLNTDPSQDISAIENIAHVLKNGQFIYRGDNPALPFISAKKAAGVLWMSGQLGNLPGTMKLAGNDIETQMHQTMKNIGFVLQDHNLDYSDITKCTLMLANIDDWAKASEVYKSYFPFELPTRSAFAASGLALNAKVEVECLATP